MRQLCKSSLSGLRKPEPHTLTSNAEEVTCADGNNRDIENPTLAPERTKRTPGFADWGRSALPGCRERGEISHRAMPSDPCNPAGCSQRFSERKIQIYSDFGGLKMHSVH